MTTHHRFANQPGSGAANSAAFALEPAPVFGAKARAGLRRAVAGFVQPIVRRRRERSDIRELRALSDATLKDIGVSRSEILGLVRQRHEDQEAGRHARG